MRVEIYRDVAVLRVHDAGRNVSRVRARSVEKSVDELTGSGLGLLLVGELAASAWSVRPTAIGKEVVAVRETPPDRPLHRPLPVIDSLT